MKHLIIMLAAVLLLGLSPYAGADGWDGSGGSVLPASVAEVTGNAAALPVPVPGPESPRRVICVDPGHPNTFNTATTMVNGTNENHINWVVALKLERILKEKGFEVMMTKSAEMQMLENKERALMGNRSGAGLCVHLHCESTPGSGFAVYYPDRQGTFEYHNDPDNGFKGPSAQVMAGSLTAAQVMSKAMKEKLAGILSSRGLLGDSRTAVGESQGALTFSIFSKIPTITIEMLVLTNASDARFAKSEDGQEKMAQAIAAGIMQYQAR